MARKEEQAMFAFATERKHVCTSYNVNAVICVDSAVI